MIRVDAQQQQQEEESAFSPPSKRQKTFVFCQVVKHTALHSLPFVLVVN
jgi:hypothetical protein